MPSDITVDADAFGATLRDVLGRVDDAVQGCVAPSVEEGAEVVRDQWRDNAPRLTGRYAKSISYKVTGSGGDTFAEVGSRRYPGLPHLLEKGHAKVGGGRVGARPHIADAAEAGFDATMEAFERNLQERLEAL